MAILKNPESAEVKEMAKWEQFHSEWTVGGLSPGNPYRFWPYPKMVYMARQAPSGKWLVSDTHPTRFGYHDDQSWERACMEVDRFNAACWKIVNDESEDKKAQEEGWRSTPGAAMEWRQSLEKAVGDAAAERNYRDRNMSEKALAESKAAEAEHFGHLAEIPEKRRGRPRKTA